MAKPEEQFSYAAVHKKMRLKPGYKILFLNTPADLVWLLEQLPPKVQVFKSLETIEDQKINFIALFSIKKVILEQEIIKLKNSITQDTVVWVCYPKAKALETDLNRDILRDLLLEYNLKAVSLVSINGTWSALRVKLVDI